MDVGSGGEGTAAGPGHDYRADLGVVLERGNGLVDLPGHGPVHGIQNLRPVQGDDANAAVSFHKYGHRVIILGGRFEGNLA